MENAEQNKESSELLRLLPEAESRNPFDVRRKPVGMWGCSDINLAYRKQFKVGKGSYGEVYKAATLSSGEYVAIKKMNMAGSGEGFPLDAMREIRFLKRLSHPHIVRLRDVSTAKFSENSGNLEQSAMRISPKQLLKFKWNFFLVLEYAEHSLKGLLDGGAVLSAVQVRSAMRQILEGLAYLHEQKVMHRDLKCSNIMLNAQGIVKIADFGMSTVFVPRRLRPPSKHLVTLWYRAPELLLGAPYTEAIDLWSVGCIFGELLTGKPIFPGKNEEEQIRCIISRLGEPSGEALKAVPQLSQFMEKFRTLGAEISRNKLADFLKVNPKVDDETLDLLFSLLEYDPERRITARAALEHPYFSHKIPEPENLLRFEGETHEYLLAVQKVNELMGSTLATESLSTSAQSLQQGSASSFKALEPRKRPLSSLKSETAGLEPSAKRLCIKHSI